MEEPSHSFNARALPGKSLIASRISLEFAAHSSQTEFTFEINSS